MAEVREDVMNLASALGIDLSGLGDDVLEAIGLRIVAEDILPTKPAIQGIVDEVRRAETGALARPAPVSAPTRRRPRYLATETTTRREKDRLATVHRLEDVRTGLNVRPRRPDPIPALKAHPACLAAAADGAEPCSRCAWLLGADVPYMDAHVDDEAY